MQCLVPYGGSGCTWAGSPSRQIRQVICLIMTAEVSDGQGFGMAPGGVCTVALVLADGKVAFAELF